MSDGKTTVGPEEKRLGAAFFDGDAAEELAKLRDEERAARDLIAEATGITDAALLADLAGLGIRVETLSALTLVPLIDVAWADHEMDDAERAAVLTGAESVGIEPGSTSYRLLEIWTREEQPPDLVDLWRDFTRALCKQLTPDEREHLEQKLLDRARAVAASAGDTRNRTPHVSDVENEHLEALARAFRD